MKSIWKKHGLAKNEIFSPLKSSNHQWFFFRRRQVRVARQSEDGSWFPWHENSAIYRPFRFSLRWRWQRQKMLFINCYIVVYYLVSHMVDATDLLRIVDAKEGLGFGLGGCWRSVAHMVGATHMVYVLGNQWLERERWMKVKMQKDPWRPATEIVAHIAWHVFLKEKCKFLGLSMVYCILLLRSNDHWTIPNILALWKIGVVGVEFVVVGVRVMVVVMVVVVAAAFAKVRDCFTLLTFVIICFISTIIYAVYVVSDPISYVPTEYGSDSIWLFIDCIDLDMT